MQVYFLQTNIYLSVMFGIHDASKYFLMSRPQKVGLFSLKFNGNTHFSTKLQKTHHLEHKSYGKWLSWKTEFLHILIGIKKSFNSSVFLMYLRHLLTSPAPPFHIETVKRRGREKFRTEPPHKVCSLMRKFHLIPYWTRVKMTSMIHKKLYFICEAAEQMSYFD